MFLCGETGQDHVHLRPAAVVAAAENVSEVVVVAVVDVAVNVLVASSRTDRMTEKHS